MGWFKRKNLNKCEGSRAALEYCIKTLNKYQKKAINKQERFIYKVFIKIFKAFRKESINKNDLCVIFEGLCDILETIETETILKNAKGKIIDKDDQFLLKVFMKVSAGFRKKKLNQTYLYVIVEGFVDILEKITPFVTTRNIHNQEMGGDFQQSLRNDVLLGAEFEEKIVNSQSEVTSCPPVSQVGPEKSEIAPHSPKISTILGNKMTPVHEEYKIMLDIQSKNKDLTGEIFNFKRQKCLQGGGGPSQIWQMKILGPRSSMSYGKEKDNYWCEDYSPSSHEQKFSLGGVDYSKDCSKAANGMVASYDYALEQSKKVRLDKWVVDSLEDYWGDDVTDLKSKSKHLKGGRRSKRRSKSKSCGSTKTYSDSSELDLDFRGPFDKTPQSEIAGGSGGLIAIDTSVEPKPGSADEEGDINPNLESENVSGVERAENDEEGGTKTTITDDRAHSQHVDCLKKDTNSLIYDSQVFVEVKLQSHNLSTLIDFGAPCSVISSKLVTNLGFWPWVSQSDSAVEGVGSHVLRGFGTIFLEVEFANSHFKEYHPFEVVENSENECIMGQDFLKQYHVSVQYGAKPLLFSNFSSIYAPIALSDPTPSPASSGANVQNPIKNKVCQYHLQQRCKFGSGCRYVHNQQGFDTNTPCKHFLEGNCKFGRKCWYQHPQNLSQTHPNHFHQAPWEYFNTDRIFPNMKPNSGTYDGGHVCNETYDGGWGNYKHSQHPGQIHPNQFHQAPWEIFNTESIFPNSSRYYNGGYWVASDEFYDWVWDDYDQMWYPYVRGTKNPYL